MNDMGFKMGKVRAVNDRRKFNLWKLSGGAYIANGSFKCVIDATDAIGCVDNTLDVDHAENYVKVVLTKSEFDTEVQQTKWLRNAINDTGMMTLSVADNLASCIHARHAEHMIDAENQPNQHCNVVLDQPSDLVVAVVERASKFPGQLDASKLYLVWDVLYTLSQFEEHGVMHFDVKAPNIMVHNNIAKMIDFGWTTTYDTFVNTTMATCTYSRYPCWPTVIATVCSLTVAARRSVARNAWFREILSCTDKHGFAVMLMYFTKYVGITVPPWTCFKNTSQQRQLTCETLTVGNKAIDASRWLVGKNGVQYDPFYDAVFYSWQTMYNNLQSHFGLPVSRLADHVNSMRLRHSKAVHKRLGSPVSMRDVADVTSPITSVARQHQPAHSAHFAHSAHLAHPAQSARSARSARSAQPAQSARSAQSAHPAQSARSAQSAHPAQSARSAQSAHPAQSARSAQSAQLPDLPDLPDKTYNEIVATITDAKVDMLRSTVKDCAMLIDRLTKRSTVKADVDNAIINNPLISDAQLVEMVFVRMRRALPPITANRHVTLFRVDCLMGCFTTWVSQTHSLAALGKLLSADNTFSQDEQPRAAVWVRFLTPWIDTVCNDETQLGELCKQVALKWVSLHQPKLATIIRQSEAAPTAMTQMLDVYEQLGLTANRGIVVVKNAIIALGLGDVFIPEVENPLWTVLTDPIKTGILSDNVDWVGFELQRLIAKYSPAEPTSHTDINENSDDSDDNGNNGASDDDDQ
jgi:hypothetical protein